MIRRDLSRNMIIKTRKNILVNGGELSMFKNIFQTKFVIKMETQVLILIQEKK